MRSHIPPTSYPQAPTVVGVLQRKCQQCDQADKLLQRQDTQGADPTAVPPIVNQVLRSPGQPLASPTRQVMESRFQHDFSQVRVHHDGAAATSAQAVNALAYTVGSHVVFGTRQYSPNTSQGQRLLAHELTHVVQQRHRPSSIPMTSAISGFDDALEDEADELANRVVAGERVAVKRKVASAGTLYRLTPPGPVLQQLHRLVQLLSASCDRTAPLTWHDFAGPPQMGSAQSARTFTDEQLVSVGAGQAVQAVFDSQRSWVKPKFVHPNDQSQNGCQPQISQCQQLFDRAAREGRTGATFRLGTPGACAAAITPDPSVVATSRSECDSAIAPECNRVAQLESQRLLRHEQGHYDIACEVAKKGTLAILSGGNPQRTLRRVTAVTTRQIRLYDRQTQHGCNATQQANWESNIAAGLPAVTIP
ncbi:MAG: DUF4157 domain-containing protein [Cyanobacteria bacterium P01_D01_bin.14]